MIKAILFDLDDLMVNSAPLHTEASRRVFKQKGINIDTLPHEFICSFYGKRVSEIMHMIVDYYKLDETIDIAKMIDDRGQIFLDLIRSELEPMPGLFELLEILKPLGLKCAVASSGLKEYIELTLNKFQIRNFFQTIVSGDMVEKGKPSPDIFLMAAKKLNVDPASCIVLEDASAGIQAAKTAGMKSIGVDNCISEYKQDLSEADAVVQSLDEINLDLLNSLGGNIK